MLKCFLDASGSALDFRSNVSLGTVAYLQRPRPSFPKGGLQIMPKLTRMATLAIVSALLVAGSLPAESKRSSHHQVRLVTGTMPTTMQLTLLGNRDRQLRAQISSELQTGQLTHFQATSLITMLNQINRAQISYMSDCSLSQAESDAIVSAMGSVTDQLSAATNNPGTMLDPRAMGFNLPNMGYPTGMHLPREASRQIGSVAPWWMF